MIGQNQQKIANTHNSNESIILIDSSSTDSLSKINDLKNFKIISFDYESHRLLQKEKLTHEISDSFINDDEREMLQQKAYHFSDWYKEDEIKKILEYNDFNLGKLFYHDLFIYLIPLVKKFHEVQKISQIYPNAVFFCTGELYQMMQLFSSSVDQIFTNFNQKKEFYYDNIILQNNRIKIKIPRAYYFKFKKFLELGIHYMFGPDNQHAKEGILLVEFNTNQYSKLFDNLKRHDEHIFFYGRKRPALWNLESISVIKKSKCKIITSHGLMSNKLSKIISNDRIKIREKTSSLFQHNNFFESFFSLNGVSFWNIIKQFFVDLCARRFYESVTELQLASELLKRFRPKCVMVLSESGYTEQFIIHEANRLSIPVILVQHGLGAFDSPKSKELNEFTGSIPILSDFFLVWGEAMQRYSKQVGIPDEKIKLVGSISHDKTFEIAKNYDSKKEFILISAGSTTLNHINDYTVKAYEDYLSALRIICKTVTKAKKKLLIKYHPYIDDKNELEIVREIDPSIKIIKKGNMLSLIQSCEFLITVHITSAILDAQILNKPVFRMPLGEWWGPANHCRLDPGLTIYSENFEEVFSKIFQDKTFYESAIHEGKNFVNDCLINLGTASESIADFIKKTLQSRPSK